MARLLRLSIDSQRAMLFASSRSMVTKLLFKRIQFSSKIGVKVLPYPTMREEAFTGFAWLRGSMPLLIRSGLFLKPLKKLMKEI